MVCSRSRLSHFKPSSVRIPAAFCGLYGLRPSYERFPYCNAVNTQEGQQSLPSTLGPMASSLSAVKRFTKTIIDAKPWNKDPLVVRKPWSSQEYELEDHGHGVAMCFAIMWDNEVIKPHPPLVRAMKLAKAALEHAGHKGKLKRICNVHGPTYTSTRDSHRLDPPSPPGDIQKRRTCPIRSRTMS